jgi:N-acetylmuramoyl-L-alanine amidase CwlA
MAKNWTDKFIPVNPYSRKGVKLKARKKIILHYTANAGAPAMNHYTYFGFTLPQLNAAAIKKGKKAVYASANIFVDRKEALCIVPIDELSFQANDVQKRNKDGSAYRGIAALRPNANELSVGVEMCLEKDGTIHPDTITRTAKVMAELCHICKLDPIDDIVRHYDVTAKNCPAPFVKDPSLMTSFKKMVKSYYDGTPTNEIPKTEPIENVTTVYGKGDKGSVVKSIQEKLILVGEKLPRYGADGSFGDEMEQAVKAFQTRAGLKPDGLVGPATFSKLDAAVAALKKPTPVPEPTPAPKPEDLPKVHSLGDKYSFQVEAREDIGVYKYSNISENQRTLKKGTVFSVYGYTEGAKAFAVPNGFVEAKNVVPLFKTVQTGGLNKDMENEFRSFLKSENIGAELNLNIKGNPSAEIEVAGLDLVKVKKFLDVKEWWYKEK